MSTVSQLMSYEEVISFVSWFTGDFCFLCWDEGGTRISSMTQLTTKETQWSRSYFGLLSDLVSIRLSAQDFENVV